MAYPVDFCDAHCEVWYDVMHTHAPSAHFDYSLSTPPNPREVRRVPPLLTRRPTAHSNPPASTPPYLFLIPDIFNTLLSSCLACGLSLPRRQKCHVGFDLVGIEANRGQGSAAPPGCRRPGPRRGRREPGCGDRHHVGEFRASQLLLLLLSLLLSFADK